MSVCIPPRANVPPCNSVYLLPKKNAAKQELFKCKVWDWRSVTARLISQRKLYTNFTASRAYRTARVRARIHVLYISRAQIFVGMGCLCMHVEACTCTKKLYRHTCTYATAGVCTRGLLSVLSTQSHGCTRILLHMHMCTQGCSTLGASWPSLPCQHIHKNIHIFLHTYARAILCASTENSLFQVHMHIRVSTKISHMPTPRAAYCANVHIGMHVGVHVHKSIQ
jgi:hypothetical protein